MARRRNCRLSERTSKEESKRSSRRNRRPARPWMAHMTPEQRSRAMRRVKLRNGPLETLVQSELRKLGLRFRRNDKKLTGTPDIVFPQEKVAIFIDGDFW